MRLELVYTLIADGNSDEALLPILTELIRQNGFVGSLIDQWANHAQLRLKKRHDLREKVAKSLDLYPCDLLFVHRDAEGESREKRVREIEEAVARASSPPPYVCVVPVKMQEAWLLISEAAIRHAAGNRQGKQRLNLPLIKEIENLPDPKGDLKRLLIEASGVRGRRKKKFDTARRARRVADYFDDEAFAWLRRLPAFRAMEQALQRVLREGQWV